jgi:hypothetical protein
LTRSAVSVIIAINRRPVSAAVVVCMRVLFLSTRRVGFVLHCNTLYYRGIAKMLLV